MIASLTIRVMVSSRIGAPGWLVGSNVRTPGWLVGCERTAQATNEVGSNAAKAAIPAWPVQDVRNAGHAGGTPASQENEDGSDHGVCVSGERV